LIIVVAAHAKLETPHLRFYSAGRNRLINGISRRVGLEYIASYPGKSNMEILTEQRREIEKRLHESSAARPLQ
jgi:hypothetical protein